MSPSILIAGATGNTGQALTQTLPKLLKLSKTLASHRIIALTRSLNNPVAQELAKVPGIEVIEKSWIEITADWLRENEVTRAFIASHNEPSQFADESTFHLNALNAGVKYVVRISTTAADVRPDTPAYYPRQHWAIEALLGTPEFSDLQWTSLQPNLFTGFALSSAAEFIKRFRETGKQDTLRLLLSENDPVALVDPGEVGILAAHLLAQDDISSHNKAKYVVNGPEDITGKQIVDLIEQQIGVPVQDVIYEDFSFIDAMYEHQFAATKQSKKRYLLN
ncbi:NmrA-like family protein [Penicillium hetheringtonii]|uniref:NmrA-like family protein n=1 Tax=Penicillium hetheringtonii TaxID=911720 RepID=A0AAD6GPW7_9EURO|nr:NmrA-like family protein [Penicillium hetheringtonii]